MLAAATALLKNACADAFCSAIDIPKDEEPDGPPNIGAEVADEGDWKPLGDITAEFGVRGTGFCRDSCVEDWKSAKSSSSSKDVKTGGGAGLDSVEGGGFVEGAAFDGGGGINVEMRDAGGGGSPSDEDDDDARLLTALGYNKANGTVDVGVGGLRLSALVTGEADDDADVGDDDDDNGGGMPICDGTLERPRLAASDLSI